MLNEGCLNGTEPSTRNAQGVYVNPEYAAELAAEDAQGVYVNPQGVYVNPEYAAEAAKTRQRAAAAKAAKTRKRAELAAEAAAEAAETKQRDAHNARSRNKSLPKWTLTKEIIRARADKILEEGGGCTETVGDIEDLIDAVMTSIMNEAEEKQLRAVGLKLDDVRSVMKDLWNEQQANTMPAGNHTIEELMEFLFEGNDEPGQAAALSDQSTQGLEQVSQVATGANAPRRIAGEPDPGASGFQRKQH